MSDQPNPPVVAPDITPPAAPAAQAAPPPAPPVLETVRVKYNGQEVDIPKADVPALIQQGLLHKNKTAPRLAQLESELEKRARILQKMENLYAANPDLAELARKRANGEPAPINKNDESDDEPANAHIRRLEAEVARLNQRIERTDASLTTDKRAREIQEAISKLPLFQTEEGKALADLFIPTMLAAKPDADPQEIAGFLHSQLSSLTKTDTLARLQAREANKDLQALPANKGTPPVGTEKRKYTTEDLHNGTIRDAVRARMRELGTRALERPTR